MPDQRPAKSILEGIRTLIKRVRRKLAPAKPSPGLDHSFLHQCSGVIHLGANTGQERTLYASYDLPVIWVEPIPAVYQTLAENINSYPKQRAFNNLVTDCDDKEYPFKVANNTGQSSSILDMKEHKDIWPGIFYVQTLVLKSVTLPSLLRRHDIQPTSFDCLVMDTQGAELLILKGAIPILKAFKFIKTEAADFEAYQGCAKLNDLSSFLADHGFNELARVPFAERDAGGKCYDVLYKRSAAA